MKNEDVELARETLNKLISNVLDDDINYGKKLLASCNESLGNYSIKGLANDYMNKMENKYGIFNRLYNFINGYILNTNNIPIMKCQNLKKQIQIIEKVKEAKELNDDLDKVDTLLKKLKEQSNV